MSTWARTGPIAVEVDGTAEGLRIVDYACMEALRIGAELILAAPYHAHAAHSPMQPGQLPEPPAELADASLRAAVAHIRHRYGYGLQLNAVSQEGSRQRVLPTIARHARMLIVGRTRARGPQRLLAAQGNLFLAGRTGCPVVVVPLSWRPSAADRKVAVGIDGTPLSAEALEFAFREAADREGDLIVLHAGEDKVREDAGHSWITRADHAMSEALAPWASEFPEVRVTRFLTGRDAVAALVHESREVGLIVVGAHAGPLAIADPVARRSVAAMTCPVAIVPHHPTVAERERLLAKPVLRGELVVPTY
ncbi:universal stress protein family protein [Kribbella steppae]|uniref:Universal stress protein family protein n=1 Tax=Kribbella steppae TaxID=2512223 RepID=A0A4R2H416_9ACTN|nr:universal stress protein [Kribbella steppae]TCO20322.1 universal stress protein family protein [Kribbella steppae]